MVTAPIVNMGFGQVPARFEIKKFGGVNFESDRSWNTNMLHEGLVRVTCDRKDIFNDSLTVSGEQSASGYEVAVTVKSEVSGLWWNGTIKFSYDISSHRWSMSAQLPGFFSSTPREWPFCVPEQVIDKVLAGFSCYTNEQQSSVEANALRVISASLLANRSAIASAAKRHPASVHCTYIP